MRSGAITTERIVTIDDFAEQVLEQHKRPSTAKSYRDIWELHRKPYCSGMWLRDTRTYHVQGWLDKIGGETLSRNPMQHIKSVISGMFSYAKQQDYFQGENPARDTKINPKALNQWTRTLISWRTSSPSSLYSLSLPLPHSQ